METEKKGQNDLIVDPWCLVWSRSIEVRPPWPKEGIITRKSFKSWATYLLSKLSSQNFMNKSASNFRGNSEKNQINPQGLLFSSSESLISIIFYMWLLKQVFKKVIWTHDNWMSSKWRANLFSIVKVYNFKMKKYLTTLIVVFFSLNPPIIHSHNKWSWWAGMAGWLGHYLLWNNFNLGNIVTLKRLSGRRANGILIKRF